MQERAKQPLTPLVPKRPPGRPPKHGLYSKYQLAPLTDNKYAEIMEYLHGQRLSIAPSDELFVNLLARLLAQIELMGRWLSTNGLFQEDASGVSRGLPHPLVSQYLAYIGKAGELCGKLGLTPEGRIKLSRDIAQTDDFASRMQKAREQ